MVAVPLVVRGKTVAVLYADSAALPADAINLEALETLVRVAGMAVELIPVTRAAPAARTTHAEQPGANTSPETAAAAPAPGPVEAPEEQPAAVVATEAEPEAVAEFVAAPAGGEYQWGATPAAEEVAPARAEERAFDPDITLIHEAAPPVAAETSAQPATPGPLGTARRWGRDEALPIEVPDDEKRLHNDARRFARLLVSEIKLYNEQKVREGRDASDLYERLREDIDRSRQMYDKRVAPPVAARYDYFHQELVNTLAEGDQAKLGGDYPGATVSA
jgi:hypothetical protein